ncbi:MAG: hypothetical protein HC892_23845 [Saprospiraceae bacterium]|nr:hypothetical protein [Saprospiraceae bacterium]
MEERWTETSDTLQIANQKRREKNALKNVAEVFVVNESAQIGGQHILLVDDVLTTGATLEVCASKLLTLPNTRVSIVVIALVS